jgi:hypothetical protein
MVAFQRRAAMPWSEAGLIVRLNLGARGSGRRIPVL